MMLTVKKKQHSSFKLEKITYLKPLRAGKDWMPLPHHVLIQDLSVLFGTPDKTTFQVYGDGLNCVGSLSYVVSKENDYGAPLSACLGFINHNDLRKPLSFYFGYSLNGVGLVLCTLKGQQHRTADYRKTYDEVALSWEKLLSTLSSVLDAARDVKLDQEMAHHIMMRTSTLGYCSWARLSSWVRRPGSNLLELCNSFAEVNALSSPLNQLPQAYGFFRLALPLISEKLSVTL